MTCTGCTGNTTLPLAASTRRDVLNMVNVLGLPGTFSFSGDTTGNALVDFMTGRMRTFGQANGQHMKNRNWVVNGYAQDSFRMSKRLTLDYGVRYEPEQIYHDLWNQNQIFRPQNAASATINPATVSTVFPNAPAGLLFFRRPRCAAPGAQRAITKEHCATLRLCLRCIRKQQNSSVRSWNRNASTTRAFHRFGTTECSAAACLNSAAVSLTTPQGLFNNPYLGITNPFPAVFPAPSNSTSCVRQSRCTPGIQNHKWITPGMSMR